MRLWLMLCGLLITVLIGIAVFGEQVVLVVPFQLRFLASDALVLVQVLDVDPQRLLPPALVLVPALAQLFGQVGVAGSGHLVQGQVVALQDRGGQRAARHARGDVLLPVDAQRG